MSDADFRQIYFKLTEETAKILAERSKAENMNESEWVTMGENQGITELVLREF